MTEVSNDQFWKDYADGTAELEGVQTVDEVIAISLRRWGRSAGAAFFPGGCGDVELLSLLLDAGWQPVWIEASYYFAIREPGGGDGLTYTEGDIDRGIRKRA